MENSTNNHDATITATGVPAPGSPPEDAGSPAAGGAEPANESPPSATPSGEEAPGGDSSLEPSQDLQDESGEAGDSEGKAAEDQDYSMEMLYEESFKTYSEGEVLSGVVVLINKDYVMVDVGSKCEGRIPLSEFQEGGKITVRKGDKVEALLVKRGDDDGDMILSKDKAAKQKLWDDLVRLHAEDGSVEGTVTGKVKGGLNVDINGIPAFLPGSQLDVRTVKSSDPYIGNTYRFLILKINRRRGNVVLSRRGYLLKESESRKAHVLATLEEGAVVEGVVKNLTPYGAFVDLGGLDGLLHITDVSWGRTGKLEDHLKPGQKVKTKVLSFDKEKGKVSLGLKQLQEDPWTSTIRNFNVGDRIQGRVVSLTEYGAFVEVAPGMEGLIHVSEMSWTRKVRNPSTFLKVDDIVECVIHNIDYDAKRISLSMKQVEPNPWSTVAERYPINSIIEGKIKSITDFGIFIGIDEGIDGLVHISDISWNRRNRHPSEMFKKGDSVRAVILAIDIDHERFSLGIKQLEDDPWLNAAANYPVGKSVTGKINSITEFGIFVTLQEGIDGLIHYSQASIPKGKTLNEVFNVGDEIGAKVLSISPAEHKIGLSLKSSGRGLDGAADSADFGREPGGSKQPGSGPSGQGSSGFRTDAFSKLGALIDDKKDEGGDDEPSADEPSAADGGAGADDGKGGGEGE
ncbi:MAG: 30S ribosomal protein S1 [Deltaproteobacteria bacterium]|jgi:small subunit ribosomal protein S1|nr:30S ribosomal protein S1 [Deltaproteobacteria bacterium]